MSRKKTENILFLFLLAVRFISSFLSKSRERGFRFCDRQQLAIVTSTKETKRLF
jgi:hypothetical protein